MDEMIKYCFEELYEEPLSKFKIFIGLAVLFAIDIVFIPLSTYSEDINVLSLFTWTVVTPLFVLAVILKILYDKFSAKRSDKAVARLRKNNKLRFAVSDFQMAVPFFDDALRVGDEYLFVHEANTITELSEIEKINRHIQRLKFVSGYKDEINLYIDATIGGSKVRLCSINRIDPVTGEDKSESEWLKLTARMKKAAPRIECSKEITRSEALVYDKRPRRYD